LARRTGGTTDALHASREAGNHPVSGDIGPVGENLISTSRVDGFIISDVGYHDPRVARLSAMHAPLAAFGGMYVPDADFAYVDVDSQQGIDMVVNHLLEQGHERIGLITYLPGLPFGDARENGYRAAMAGAGLDVLDDWIAYTPNILHSASVSAHKLMSSRIPPTAIVCTNDLMAFGVWSYLSEAGLHVPDDIALTGYDDDPTAEFLGITSVRQPIDEIARVLFDILLGEINQEPLDERQVVFAPELIVRRSTSS
jgi:DNA-binding LacI/PurR family transcriptional regulator